MNTVENEKQSEFPGPWWLGVDVRPSAPPPIWRGWWPKRSRIDEPGGIHPATKVFQALRIAVNREEEALLAALPQAVEIMNTGGVLAVISFHSGEDRAVKHFLRERSSPWLDTPARPNTVPNPRHHLRGMKRFLPTEEEMTRNPRARSARLRVAIRTRKLSHEPQSPENSQSLHWIGVVKWILIAGLLSVLGLSYMLCKNQNLHLAEETYRLEKQLDGIQKRNAQLTYDLETMKSPLRLQRRLAIMHSTLIRLSDMGSMVVRMDQIVHAVVPSQGTVPQGGLNYGSYNTTAVASSASLPPNAPAQATP